jgi:hypothetical protein
MKNEQRNEYVTRESVLKLLSDNENARVSTAEAAALANGDEYLDLEHIDQGIKKAHGTTAKTGSVLPKKSVEAATWTKILAHLKPAHGPKNHSHA